MRIAAIVNPVSGWGATRRIWPSLLHTRGLRGATVETFWSEHPGHSEILAANARRSGYDRVISVGGDGTLFEVLNGLWWEQKGNLPSVGMVPVGTGCDYIRNFEVGASMAEAFRTAESPSAISVSLGRFGDRNNKVRPRVFAMVLGMGFDAEVVRLFRSGRFGRAGWQAYALSTLAAFNRLYSFNLNGSLDGLSFSGRAISFGTALGRWFGKRIEIAPSASPVRRDFEAVWIEPANFSKVLSLVFLAYFGAHYKLPWVKTMSAHSLAIETSPPVWIEADGELIGKTPVEIDIIPEAFCFAAKGIRKRIGPREPL